MAPILAALAGPLGEHHGHDPGRHGLVEEPVSVGWLARRREYLQENAKNVVVAWIEQEVEGVQKDRVLQGWGEAWVVASARQDPARANT